MKNSIFKSSRSTLFLLLFIFVSLTIFAQNNIKDYRLYLKAEIFSTEENINTFINDNGKSELEEFKGNYYCYLQFYDIPKQSTRELLDKTGIELLEYMPEYAYIASIPTHYDFKKLQDFNVRSIIKIESNHKISRTLIERPYPEWAMIGDEIKAVIKYHKNIEPSSVKQAITEEGIRITESNDYSGLVTIVVPINKIKDIAELPFISYMELVAHPPVPDDTRGRSLHRSNVINSDYASGRHYDGTGVHCAIGDDGGVGPHIDVKGRITQHTAGYGGTHGDMTSGILMGAGNIDPTVRGMATGAHLHMYDISGYPHIMNAPANLTTLGTVITSTSYSQTCGGEYTTDAAGGDQMIRQNPSLLHVFSAGNAGTSNCNYGAGAGWGNITGGLKAAKNVITCGNLDYLGVLQTSSSRGPAADGRIKPDICSNGANQMSMDPPNLYGPGGGTSAAAPGIAGICAQLYHAYRILNNGQNPESPLIKACLLNTAEDYGNPGPDYSFGWGRVNAYRAVKILEDERYFDSTITQGVTHNYTVNVPSGIQQIRIMLYWLDYEGSTTAAKALVNDLKLQVINPALLTYNPWVLNPTPNAVTLNNQATRGNDSLNNMEQVTINNPVTGNFTIKVIGNLVPQGPQKYYIVYEMLTDDIEVTYPFGGEGFVPFELETIRWDTYGNTGSFTIEYSSDNGLNWNTINTSVPGYRRYFTWSVPNIVTGKALIRVSRGVQSNISNESFTIIKVPQNLSVDWACPDSCQLTWNAVQGATSYVIRMLGNMYMDSIGHSTTNNFTVKNINPIDDFWFSVQALGPNNAIGRRAYAIVKNPGVWNCQLAVDAELVEIIGLSTSTLQNCQDYSSVHIDVKIKNNGLSNILNIPLYYQHNNGTVIPETFSGTITPGDSANYTFTSSVDISSIGNHEIKVWLNYSSDGNVYNDSNIVNVKLIAGTTLSPDVTEDFQNFSLCNTSSYCELVICNLSNGWINPPNLEDDDIDWRIDNGTTPSTNTGPTYDHTLGNPAGKYIYVEASSCFEKTAHLLSPCFDLTSATHPVLDFWYNMLGSDMGSLHVDILTGTYWNLDIINPISYNQGALWKNRQIDLSAYNGQTINIRFRGISGPGYQSDIALDDISVIETSGIGIHDNVQQTDILVYPNPGKGLFNLSINNLSDNWVDVSIYDLQGRVMYNEHIKNRSDHYVGSINLSGISSGIYFLKVQNDNIFYIKKVVVQ